MHETIAVLTHLHGGVFTRAQAVAAGLSDRDLRMLLQDRHLLRLRQGCYTPRSSFEILDARARHLLLARAAVACQLGPVALTGVTAAVLHGLDLHEPDLGTVHLVRLDAGSPRAQPGIRQHQLTHEIVKDLQSQDGFLVVSPARTVWEVATSSTLEAAVCTADSALHRWPELRDELLTIGGTFSRRPGSRTARVAVQLADGRSGSVGESLSRVLFYRHAIPRPELQHEVRLVDGTLVAVTDFYWEAHHHVGEFDGKVKYTELLREGETPGDAVFREKRREDAVRGCQLGVTRWTFVDLTPRLAPGLILRLNADLERSRTLYARRSA
jgi:hypothetical protein